MDKLSISFDYYFAGSDDSDYYSDVFEATFLFKVNDTLLEIWNWDYNIYFATSEDIMETVVHYNVLFDVSDIENQNPNAIVQFGLIESAGITQDLTETWIGVDNVNVAPVPEPATILLFGAGLIGIAGFARKKVQK